MSQENVEIVRRCLERLWDRRDMDAAFECVDPDVELDWSRSRAPYAGTVRGREAARRWFESVWEGAFSDQVVERRGFTDLPPDAVAVEQVIRATGRSSGIEARATGTTVWTVRDGKVVQGRLYQSKDEALKAAGLSE